MVTTCERRCSASSGADVRAREKRQRIQRERWGMLLLLFSRRQVALTICWIVLRWRGSREKDGDHRDVPARWLS